MNGQCCDPGSDPSHLTSVVAQSFGILLAPATLVTFLKQKSHVCVSSSQAPGVAVPSLPQEGQCQLCAMLQDVSPAQQARSAMRQAEHV